MAQRSDARMRGAGRRPAAVAPARSDAVARATLAIMWICLGAAGVSAVAAAAIYLPLPQGRSALAPELRSSIAAPLRELDIAPTWHEEWTQLVGTVGVGLRGADTAWMPEGGLSTLLATRFPTAAHVRLPSLDIATPMPPARPDGVAREDMARQEFARQDIVRPDTLRQDTLRQDTLREDAARLAFARQDVGRQDVARQDIAPRASVVRTTPVAPQIAALPPQQPKSEPGIFDRLFGDPDRAAKAVVAANPKTVLYDIARRSVYMPGGERLEAHSGLGQFMDDPQSIERKDVGVTPPNVYAVSFREKPFHGVRALRMKPIGNGNMYGRDGILAHSYLLGEAGGSNGCISVRDYDKFLQAFEDGKFDKIIVVRSVDEPMPSQLASNQADGT